MYYVTDESKHKLLTTGELIITGAHIPLFFTTLHITWKRSFLKTVTQLWFIHEKLGSLLSAKGQLGTVLTSVFGQEPHAASTGDHRDRSCRPPSSQQTAPACHQWVVLACNLSPAPPWASGSSLFPKPLLVFRVWAPSNARCFIPISAQHTTETNAKFWFLYSQWRSYWFYSKWQCSGVPPQNSRYRNPKD